jgi:hypothetical protein
MVSPSTLAVVVVIIEANVVKYRDRPPCLIMVFVFKKLSTLAIA